MTDPELREQVRARYAGAAAAVTSGAQTCCTPSEDTFGPALYSSAERAELPAVEDVPLPDAAVDVVISNCVVNLSTDKPAVLREMFRVLVPGGRIGISDVVAEDHLTPADRAERGSYVGCIAGALSRGEYLDGLAAAGFVHATVEFTHEAAPGMHSALVRARKPAA